MSLVDIAVRVQSLLTGEPLRAIQYGAIAVVYLVVKGAIALGYVVDQPDLDGIAIAVAAAIAVVTEVSRRFVFSPNTVQTIATFAALTGDDTVPAPPAG